MYNIPNIKTVTPVEATIHTHCRNTKHLEKKKKNSWKLLDKISGQKTGCVQENTQAWQFMVCHRIFFLTGIVELFFLSAFQYTVIVFFEFLYERGWTWSKNSSFVIKTNNLQLGKQVALLDMVVFRMSLPGTASVPAATVWLAEKIAWSEYYED